MSLLGSVAAALFLITPPEGFVDISGAVPGVLVDARYASAENFMARQVDGYLAPKSYLSTQAAAALALVQAELKKRDLGLKVFDGYRPQRAVDDFMAWIADTADIAAKARYYPGIKKSQLVPEGYIAEKSGHSRGSTVDLTLVDLASGDELDMGSPWDFFGPVSHALINTVPEKAQENRMLLRTLMIKHGFNPYEAEWWHFTLAEEPYPETYFDFVID